jgi:hypothetical protein
VAPFGSTGRRHKSNVTLTNNRDLQSSLSPHSR